MAQRGVKRKENGKRVRRERGWLSISGLTEQRDHPTSCAWLYWEIQFNQIMRKFKIRWGTNKRGNTLYSGQIRLRGGDETRGNIQEAGREQNKHLHFEVEEERVSKERRAKPESEKGGGESRDA